MQPHKSYPDMPELKQAALAAHAYLTLEAARLYGFVTGAPEVNVERCEEAIERAEEAGIEITAEEIDQARADCIAWHTAPPEARAAAFGEGIA